MITCGHLPEPSCNEPCCRIFQLRGVEPPMNSTFSPARESAVSAQPQTNHCCRSMRPGSGAVTGECACIQRLIMSYWEPCSVLFVACSKVR